MFLFDFVMLAVVVFVVDRDEASDMFNLVVAAVLISVVNFVLVLKATPQNLPLVLAAILVFDGLVIRWRFTLTWTKTVVALGMFVGAKIVFYKLVGGFGFTYQS